MLRFFGHAKVSVLNGGLKSWISIGGKTESGAKMPVATGQFTIRPSIATNVIKHSILQALVADGIAGQIADARSAGRFAGTEQEPRSGLRSGHIPGSSNVPITTLLNDGALKDKDDLAAAFAVGGIDVNRPVITTCGSGVTACGLALALAILGNRETFVYDGSWSEWGGEQCARRNWRRRLSSQNGHCRLVESYHH